MPGDNVSEVDEGRGTRFGETLFRFVLAAAVPLIVVAAGVSVARATPLRSPPARTVVHVRTTDKVPVQAAAHVVRGRVSFAVRPVAKAS